MHVRPHRPDSSVRHLVDAPGPAQVHLCVPDKSGPKGKDAKWKAAPVGAWEDDVALAQSERDATESADALEEHSALLMVAAATDITVGHRCPALRPQDTARLLDALSLAGGDAAVAIATLCSGDMAPDPVASNDPCPSPPSPPPPAAVKGRSRSDRKQSAKQAKKERRAAERAAAAAAAIPAAAAGVHSAPDALGVVAI